MQCTNAQDVTEANYYIFFRSFLEVAAWVIYRLLNTLFVTHLKTRWATWWWRQRVTGKQEFRSLVSESKVTSNHHHAIEENVQRLPRPLPPVRPFTFPYPRLTLTLLPSSSELEFPDISSPAGYNLLWFPTAGLHVTLPPTPNYLPHRQPVAPMAERFHPQESDKNNCS